MNRTYVSLDQHPDLMQIPWNSVHWLDTGKVHCPVKRFNEPEAAYSTMFRMMWRYYLMSYNHYKVGSQERVIHEIRDYQEGPLDIKIDLECSTVLGLLPLKDWRAILLYHVKDTLLSKTTIFYGFSHDDWHWPTVAVSVLPQMIHFVKENVELLENLKEDKKYGRKIKLPMAAFRLDV